jgi:hypothetical protein
MHYWKGRLLRQKPSRNDKTDNVVRNYILVKLLTPPTLAPPPLALELSGERKFADHEWMIFYAFLERQIASAETASQ